MDCEETIISILKRLLNQSCEIIKQTIVKLQTPSDESLIWRI